MHPLLEDPWVAAQIDAALDKHRHALTPRQIQAFREKMAWTFANHPLAKRILEQARPVVPDRSGERLTPAGAAAQAAAPDTNEEKAR